MGYSEVNGVETIWCWTLSFLMNHFVQGPSRWYNNWEQVQLCPIALAVKFHMSPQELRKHSLTEKALRGHRHRHMPPTQVLPLADFLLLCLNCFLFAPVENHLRVRVVGKHRTTLDRWDPRQFIILHIHSWPVRKKSPWHTRILWVELGNRMTSQGCGGRFCSIKRIGLSLISLGRCV
jgi:hypothetical protein